MASSTSSVALSTTEWTEIGTGPLYLQANPYTGSILVAFGGASTPSLGDPGFILGPGVPPFYADTESTIYGLALEKAAAVVFGS